MTAIEIRQATAADRDTAGTLLEDGKDAEDVVAAIGRGAGQLRVAVDSSSGQLLGTVLTPPPGGRLGTAARTGELDVAGLRIAPGAERAAQALLDHTVKLARARYATAVLVDAAAQAPWAARLLEDSGFRPLPARGPSVYGLDLTGTADGTPTRVLDNPALASLNGHHARFAERRGEVSRYQADVSPWTGIPDTPSEQDWADLAELLGPGAIVPVTAAAVTPPPDWVLLEGSGGGVQMTGEAVEGRPDAELIELTPDDVPDVLAHIEATKPGPYLPRTIEVGRYLGIRYDGRLIAVAGERLHPPGWTEISAVSTDSAFRGQGLATRLVLAVAHGIRQRGETPFLHAAARNTNAIRLYERLGFRIRRRSEFRAYRIPDGS